MTNKEEEDGLTCTDPDLNITDGKFGLSFKIVSFENVTPPKNIMVKIDIDGNHLGSSEVINLEKLGAEINCEIFYEMTDLTDTVIDGLIAHPFVFSVLCEDTSVLPVSPHKKFGKVQIRSSTSKIVSLGSSRKAALSKKHSLISRASEKLDSNKDPSRNQSTASASFVTLGVASLDILPLLLGKDQMREVLLIHSTTERKGSQAIAWANLPRMQVLVSGCGNTTRRMFEKVINILHLTIESLHNITPDISDNVQAASIFPHNQEFEVAKFINGSVVVDQVAQVSRRKKWFGLSDFQGQAALSSYKVSENFTDMVNPLEYEVTKEKVESVPRVQWYQLCRRFINAESQQLLMDKLVKYRCWPLEIFISKSSDKRKEHSDTKTKSDKKSDKETVVTTSKGGADNKSDHFMTFLDLSRLLYPGVISTRVVSQLYVYSEEEMERRFGSKHDMFQVLRAPSYEGKPAKNTASKKDQSRATTPPKSPKKQIAAKVEEKIIEEEPAPLPEPEQVINAEGEPVFIVVQFELLKPLVEKKAPEEILDRQPPTKTELATINSTHAFETCIEDLMHAIHEEYQLFYTKHEKNLSEKSSKNFLMHLHVTGAYTKMKESIQESLEGYIRDTIFLPNSAMIRTMKYDSQDLLADIYTSLVTKMCDVVNFLTSFDISEYDPLISCDDLIYFAVEAMDEDTFDKAQEYLLQRLDKSKKAHPQFWLDYAMFWLRKQEFEKAGECAREAISLDARSTSALMFHGLLSWLTEDFKAAEVFLLAVVSFDPFSLEGWITLHIFHKQMDNQLAASAELLNGKKCVKENVLPPDGPLPPLLSWSADMVEPHRPFLLTAVHMLRQSFPELAELVLSYDLLQFGRTFSYLYYLAVCHFLQGRHVDSLQHLEEALTFSWQNEYLWSLKGHNLYKMQLLVEAKEAFLFAINSSDRPDNLHLVNLRLGHILMSEGDHSEARKYYLNICKFNPTPLSWLCLGITAFLGDEMKDAEAALSEANMLDCRHSRVWGYLALVNLMLAKPVSYNKCLSQALRFGLDDPVLQQRLQNLGQFVEPTTL